MAAAELMINGRRLELVTGDIARQEVDAIASVHTVIETSQTERQTTLLVRTNGPLFDPSWEVQEVALEDIVLAYLSQQATTRLSSSQSTQKQHGMEVVQ